MNRLQLKNKLIIRYGSCCDCCGDNTSLLDMHELIARGNTYTDDGREESFRQEVVVLMCKSCHANYQHNHLANYWLLMYNMGRYSYEAVYQVIEQISQYEGRWIGTDCPSKDLFESIYTHNWKTHQQVCRSHITMEPQHVY